ncbi:RNA polymerase sigma factor [Tundrisphaera sp. TA3]|uniref:RNA polymerase sigma factor n=1 Tax=Tundrisphaera sp. TA3 TaxID=3435775 RepID=UPI003EBB3800
MDRFPTTRWTLVSAAADPGSPGSKAALEELCIAYWYPVYAMIRGRGYTPEDASDLSQEYFIRILDGRLMRAADRGRGRFRSLLRKDCAYFLADHSDRLRSVKHGGGAAFLPIDDAERRFSQELSLDLDPERLFDRAWAVSLLGRAFDRLERQEVDAGRGDSFDRLKASLTEGMRSRPYAELAAEAGTTVAAVQAAIVRLRRRYREALRSEVASTLASPTDAEIDEEIRTMLELLSSD